MQSVIIINEVGTFGAASAPYVLPLIAPAPILDTLPADSFSNTVKGRLSVNGTENTLWRRAAFNAPKDSLGAAFSLDFAKADLSFLPNDAAIKFEIGIYNGTGYDFETVFDSLKINSRNLSRSWNSNAPNDSLSFLTLIDIDDKFALAPRKRIICYDANKSQVTGDEIEKLFDTDGVQILTDVRGFNGLSLYQVLRIAFIEGCGFTDFETNLPNYPLIRADFGIQTTYKDAVAPFIGIFKPIFIVLPGNILRILDGTQPIPNDFAPTAINADTYSGIGLQTQPKPTSDGYILQFQTSSDYSFYTQRFETENTSNGVFGTNSYTTTATEREFRDYHASDKPEITVKTELKKQTITTKDYQGFVISEDILETTFDSLGRITAQTKTLKAKIPQLPASGTPSYALQLVRSEAQKVSYRADRTNSRRSVLSEVETNISALVASDTDNPYLSETFNQEFLEAHRAGNLKEAMTTTFVPVKTITEKFVQDASGQVTVKTDEIDHLRNVLTDSRSEVRNGDISINSYLSKAANVVVWRVGVDKLANGKPLQTYSAGELPVFFALPLVAGVLENEDAQRDSGTAAVAGYSPSLRRGIFAAISDRDGTDLGKFLCAGYNWTIEKAERGIRVETNLEVEQVG